MIKGKVDIFLINENKLHEFFPSNQFIISGYKFIRRDRNKFGGGIDFYITDQLSRQVIKIENPSDSELLTIEMTKRKNKILVGGIYKPPNLNENHFTTNPETIINKLSNKYEKSILMVDFNVTTTA